ncbi:MAG: hypothetical protein PF518_10205 [Spirochaetaceae bacterium]|nr:hypothetical protein [Spirochaetaceae bacterium]
MAFYDFRQRPGHISGFISLNESLLAIGRDSKMVSTCIEALEILIDRLDITESPMDLGFPSALQLHGRYSRDQILAAFGENNFEKKSSSREGVLFIRRARNLRSLLRG